MIDQADTRRTRDHVCRGRLLQEILTERLTLGPPRLLHLREVELHLVDTSTRGARNGCARRWDTALRYRRRRRASAIAAQGLPFRTWGRFGNRPATDRRSLPPAAAS